MKFGHSMTDIQCAACGSLTEGYKCLQCGLEADDFIRDHLCGAEQVMPVCSVCNEVEVQCSCDIS